MLPRVLIAASLLAEALAQGTQQRASHARSTTKGGGKRTNPSKPDAPANALEALTQPYTVYSQLTTSDATTTTTIATAVTTILNPIDTSGQTTWSSTSSSTTSTPPDSSTTTAIATFTNPHSASETLTASAALPPDPWAHNTLLVYDTPVVAGSPATSINGATYSLAPSGVALYVDGQSERVPWATTRVVYSSGGGGGFVTAIASEEAGTSVVSTSVDGGGGMSVLVGTAAGGSKTSGVVALATNAGGRVGVGGWRREVVVVVGVFGAGVGLI
ncbi:hypothetical protein Tdes44962_MAKER05551 [Teratosphaeria destructans]|uniref:Uncharacterized protein n=1 Tax=Teratosphaeria destructans TaxID=418781 RepID=A0A9W7SJK6_9PEZI|nr:hypothetical protein Tdes44962_MAKER05551 [Teratosphaeria destructans]